MNWPVSYCRADRAAGYSTACLQVLFRNHPGIIKKFLVKLFLKGIMERCLFRKGQHPEIFYFHLPTGYF